MAACLTLVVSACQSTRPQPNPEGEQRSARLEAKVEHRNGEPTPIAVSAEPSAPDGVPLPTPPAAPSTPPRLAPEPLADHALLKAAGAPRAASLTQAEAHSFIRLKASIERANAAAHKKKGGSP
jgi:hypothetical protein